MRRGFLLLIALCNFCLIYGQSNSKLFYFIGDTLITEPYELISDSEIREIEGFKIEISKANAQVQFEMSSAIYDVRLRKKSNLLIVGDNLLIEDFSIKTIVTNDLEKSIKSLSLYKIIEMHNGTIFIKQTYPKKGIRVKKNRLHALRVQDGFLILYLNFKEKESTKIERLLNTFEIKQI